LLARITGNGSAFTLDATSRYRIYSLEEFFSGIGKIARVFEIQVAFARFDAVLSRFEARGDRDNPVAISRFQTRLNEWVIACNFDVTERDELRAILAVNAPARNYSVPA
jgi:hypothetical protein